MLFILLYIHSIAATDLGGDFNTIYSKSQTCHSAGKYGQMHGRISHAEYTLICFAPSNIKHQSIREEIIKITRPYILHKLH